MLKKLTFILSLTIALGISGLAQETTVETKTESQPVKTNQRPDKPEKPKEPFDGATIAEMVSKCVTLETEKGNIALEFYPESAPETVRNFLNLAATKALDTTSFSRVVPGFVIQGGNLWTSQNLTDALKWRAAERLPDEPNQILHEKGIISMARRDFPDSATTNFFILLRSASTLDKTFAAFGRVTTGIEVVEAINQMPVDDETPKDPVRIKTAIVQPCVQTNEEKKEVKSGVNAVPEKTEDQ